MSFGNFLRIIISKHWSSTLSQKESIHPYNFKKVTPVRRVNSVSRDFAPRPIPESVA